MRSSSTGPMNTHVSLRGDLYPRWPISANSPHQDDSALIRSQQPTGDPHRYKGLYVPLQRNVETFLRSPRTSHVIRALLIGRNETCRNVTRYGDRECLGIRGCTKARCGYMHMIFTWLSVCVVNVHPSCVDPSPNSQRHVSTGASAGTPWR